MYSISRKKFIQPDMLMVSRVIDKLNEKFDPKGTYHNSHEKEMFEFHLHTDGSKREAWEITFLGEQVAEGGEFGIDYSECQDEEYLTLETENESEIFSIATINAIRYIDRMIGYVCDAEISNLNKTKWIKKLMN